MPTPQLTVRDDLEAERAWRELMEPLGFSRCTLWIMLISERAPAPAIVELIDMPDEPDPADVDGLAQILGRLGDDDGALRVAFLLSRPGHDGVREADRRWAAALREVVRRASLPAFVTHLATDRQLVAMPLDDLA